MSSDEKKIRMNPIQEEEERKVAELLDKKKMMSTITVYGVKGENCNNAQHNELIAVRDYCNEHFITFTSRPFDSTAHAVDRDVITDLPAFHLHIDGYYITTVYQKVKLARAIENEMFEIEKKWKEKKKRDKETKEKKEKILSMLTLNVNIPFAKIFSSKKKLVNMKPYEKK